jgi:maltose operon protein
MMSKFAGIAFAILGAVCTGRATAGQSQRDLAAWRSARVCCTDPAQFKYEALPRSGSVEFTIDRDSPLFEFQGGRSFFRAFTLPEGGGSYRLDIQSFFAGTKPQSAQVFYPIAAILTPDQLISRATTLEGLRIELPFLERSQNGAVSLSLGLDAPPGREKYLVIFTLGELLERDRYAAHALEPAAAEAEAKEAFLGASPTGHLRITITAVAQADAPSETAAAP